MGRVTSLLLYFFFFNDTATTEIYTFPYTTLFRSRKRQQAHKKHQRLGRPVQQKMLHRRSEEHTSELQSRLHLVCRLLLEKKKKKKNTAKRSSCSSTDNDYRRDTSRVRALSELAVS